MTTRPDPDAEIAAIVLAAGSGSRMGDGDPTPKQFRDLNGEPMVRHSVRAFLDWGCRQVIVAAPPGAMEEAARALDGLPVRVVPGASSRAASTLAALAHVTAPAIFVHDAARPHLAADLIDRLASALPGVDGVIPALAVTDTVKRVEGEVIAATVPRQALRLAQTPQLFRTARLRAAHEGAAASDAEFTDDASIMEAAGATVRVVPGDPANIKVTVASDMPPPMLPPMPTSARTADARGVNIPADERPAPDVRVGHGYDTHRTKPGEAVMLCGISIPSPHALEGHSDADIGLHALTDALLGTCGEGDIGSHFPPSDPRWRGAASDAFLAHAAAIVWERGGRVTCADVTLVCEAPRIGPHREAMRARVAAILGIESARVSVKATTNERIGFVGRNEGLAALATATVIYG